MEWIGDRDIFLRRNPAVKELTATWGRRGGGGEVKQKKFPEKSKGKG